MPAMRPRIVVTGTGVISPLGDDVPTILQCLAEETQCEGRCSFQGEIQAFGELAKPTQRQIRKSQKLMNRETQLGLVAAQRAILHSQILAAGYAPERVGVLCGAGNVRIQEDDFSAGVNACTNDAGDFDSSEWGTHGIAAVDPLWMLRVLPNMPACHIAIVNDFQGPNNTVTLGRVATPMAMGEAVNAILDGDADAMIVGGTGNQRDNTFDAPEYIGAEAAGAVVLETLDRALERQATIHAEVLSVGSATSIRHDFNTDPEAAAKAALQLAQQRTSIHHKTQAFAPQARHDLRTQMGDAAAGTSAIDLLLAIHDCALSGIPVACSTHDDLGLAGCVILAKCDLLSEAAA